MRPTTVILPLAFGLSDRRRPIKRKDGPERLRDTLPGRGTGTQWRRCSTLYFFIIIIVNKLWLVGGVVVVAVPRTDRITLSSVVSSGCRRRRRRCRSRCSRQTSSERPFFVNRKFKWSRLYLQSNLQSLSRKCCGFLDLFSIGCRRRPLLSILVAPAANELLL